LKFKIFFSCIFLYTGSSKKTKWA